MNRQWDEGHGFTAKTVTIHGCPAKLVTAEMDDGWKFGFIVKRPDNPHRVKQLIESTERYETQMMAFVKGVIACAKMNGWSNA